MGNAIKFSPEGETIIVKLMQKDDQALISVTDHGIGIPDELKQHVFEVPDKTRRPGTAAEQSFGLGLAISKQIVTLHGGRIWFEDTTGGGTTFYIGLPLNERD
nr:ATP-binding protein [Pedobacter sp. JY14-1]